VGREAERQFAQFNQAFYPAMNLKPVENTYQRGWFHSYAVSTFETTEAFFNIAPNERFVLLYEIEHGFVPIQSTLIRITLHTAPLINAKPTEVSFDAALLEVRMAVQTNSEGLTLKMSALPFKNDNIPLQWQSLQGHAHIKHNFATVEAEMHSPQMQFNTHQGGHIVIQNAKFNAQVQLGADFMPSETSLSIADMQLVGFQMQPVKLEGIKLAGKNHVVGENLRVAVNTKLQQIHVGTEDYGPAYGDFELRRWHAPTLKRIKNTLVEIRHQGVSPEIGGNMAMYRLMSDGMALLKNAPEFAITRLDFNTPAGELQSVLRVKMEQKEGIAALFYALINHVLFNHALFNPSLLVNALNAQLEMHIPQSLFQQLTEETLLTVTPAAHKTIGQHLKTWLAQGILVHAKNKPDYYYTRMQLHAGVLQVNGQRLPIADLIIDNSQ
jgi:uncharacterized protein YdgA (DUF945 family)